MIETVRLKSVFLHVTKACNLRCSYCYFSADRPLPDEMTEQEYAALWPDLAALRPEKLVVTGGEPLLRPDLFELLRGFRAADPGRETRLCLNTNGHLVDANVAERLVGLADEVRVSLDGAETVNDALRGAGNAGRALRALELLRDEGFEPKVLVTVTQASLAGLPDFLCDLARRGFTRVNLNLFRPIGRGREEDALRVDEADIRTALREARRRLLPGEPPLREPAESRQRHCGAGRFLNVLPDGGVFPCHALTDSRFACGNLRRDSLTDICARSGLLGRLSRLDYRTLEAEHPRLAGLTRSGACLGEAYSRTEGLALWDELAPPGDGASGLL